MVRLPAALPLLLIAAAAAVQPQAATHSEKRVEPDAAVSLVSAAQEQATRHTGSRGTVVGADEGYAALLGERAERIALALKTGSGGVTFRAALAEYIAMTLFVTIGCGCAMGVAKEPGAAWILQVSLTFGLAITSLAYAVGAYSGGQINCAVTLGLMLVGQLNFWQGVLNIWAQTLGSLTGAYILCVVYPKELDRTQSLASNGINEGFSRQNAFIGEIMMTFLLVFVVLETAVNPNSEANRALACVAIGFSVFLAHCVLIPVDGCSINPTRSFGPAFVSQARYAKADAFKDFPVFVAGPLLGAVLAAIVYGILRAV